MEVFDSKIVLYYVVWYLRQVIVYLFLDLITFGGILTIVNLKSITSEQNVKINNVNTLSEILMTLFHHKGFSCNNLFRLK